MSTYAWLRLALYSSHHKYKKRLFLVMPKLSKRKKKKNFTSLPSSTSKQLNPCPHQTAECLHCTETNLQAVKLSSEHKHFYLYRPATGLRVAETKANSRNVFVKVAKLLQICHKTLSYCFVSVLSVHCGPGLSSINHAQNKLLMDTC